MKTNELKGLSQETLQELAMKGLRAKAQQQRQWIKTHLLAKKAMAAGIKVSDEEIAEYLVTTYKAKVK